jgi:transposase
MDRGFVMEDNIVYMAEKGYRFIVPFPMERTETAVMLDRYGQSIRRAANRINEVDLYGTSFDYELFGVPMKAHIFFDPEKQNLDEKELYARIARLSGELKKMSGAKRVTRRYTDFFAVEEEKSGINFEMDYDKVDERLKKAGFCIFLTTDMLCDPETLIRIYRGRDVIEKNFCQLKNGLDFRRLRTHINETTDGKVFVGFLALILRTYLLGKVKAQTETKRFTLDKVLLELKKIKTVTMSDQHRLVTPLTKTQKTILAALGISHEVLTNSIS